MVSTGGSRQTHMGTIKRWSEIYRETSGLAKRKKSLLFLIKPYMVNVPHRTLGSNRQAKRGKTTGN